MRVALVTAAYGDPWIEEQFIWRRVAAAIASYADVDVLVAGGCQRSEGVDGALRVLHFPSRVLDVRRRHAVLFAATGARRPDAVDYCACTRALTVDAVASLPQTLQDELARSEEGNSPALYAHLETERYDAIVLCGLQLASTAFGIARLPASARVVLLPVLAREPLIWLPPHQAALTRAERIIVSTKDEELRVRRLVSVGDPGRIVRVAVPIRVDVSSAMTEPLDFDGAHQLVVAGVESVDLTDIARQAIYLSQRIKRLTVSVVARDGRSVSSSSGIEVRSAVSRSDLWRWMVRAFAVLDAGPPRPLAREVLEAMLCGVPAIVRDQTGAAREHAEQGNGGLWYRTDLELLACTARLFEDTAVRQRLGEQGREYATHQHGDPTSFVEQVKEAVLG